MKHIYIRALLTLAQLINPDSPKSSNFAHTLGVRVNQLPGIVFVL